MIVMKFSLIRSEIDLYIIYICIDINVKFVDAGKGLPIMDCATRLRIAIGSAKGLAYLHEDCKNLIFSVPFI